MIISFNELAKNYPTKEEFTHDALFDELGWQDLKTNPSYTNTCAIRMSYCLIRAGLHIPGRMKIKSGPHKGQMIEPGQAKLTAILSTPKFLGSPIVFKPKDRPVNLKGKQGIISFMRIPGYMIDGGLSGHIDLVHHETLFLFWNQFICAEDCYWNASECRFWPLNAGG